MRTSYTHRSSTGETTTVFTEGTSRWYRQPGQKGAMMLPAIPNRDHGRYFAAVIAGGVTLRREYRQLHDDWMLPTTPGVAEFDNRHEARLHAESVHPGNCYNTMGERRLDRYLRTGI